jgi:uncharacterized damage-inducible protein DinB
MMDGHFGRGVLMSIASKLLPEVDEEFAITRKFLELLPEGKATWKPHDKSMQMGQLAWHLAGFPEWMKVTLTQDVLNLSPAEAEKMSKEWQGRNRAEIVAKFDTDLAQARKALSVASDADLANHWKMVWAGQTVVDSPRDEVLRKWVLSHMIHHRAQLGVYLRINGIAIPGCYGPSADEMAASGTGA